MTTSLQLAFWIVAGLLFLMDGGFWWLRDGWVGGRFTSLGLFFLTLGFIVGH